MTTSYARIVDGMAVEIINLVEGQTPETNYTPEIAAMFVQCPTNVEQFWTYANGQWAAPVIQSQASVP